jgi:long-chain acyl-CoA synthetase
MAGVSVRVVGGDGAPAADGEVGEITLRVPSGQRRYWHDDPEGTFQDGWVRTGDLGRLDEDGFLYVVGRTKDVIIRGGYNITPVEVENAIYEHPAVAEVAVVGVDHAVLGQDVCAVVRARHGATMPALAELREFLSERIADYKQPRRLVVLEVPLPRTPAGKVDKEALSAALPASE